MSRKAFAGDRHVGEKATDTWLTPLPLIRSLGKFDLDPCAFPGHKTATRGICLPEDGMLSEWKGRVWLNPPYGRATGLWLERLADHGVGTALVFARTDTRWFQETAERSSAYLFLEGRVYFLKPDGSESDRAGAPSMLIAYGDSDAEELSTAVDLGLLNGVLVRKGKYR